jgi:hypothetical protein
MDISTGHPSTSTITSTSTPAPRIDTRRLPITITIVPSRLFRAPAC